MKKVKKSTVKDTIKGDAQETTPVDSVNTEEPVAPPASYTLPDDFDNVNPFETNTKMRFSPTPNESQHPDDNQSKNTSSVTQPISHPSIQKTELSKSQREEENPFQTKQIVSNSPTENMNKLIDDQNPFETKSKIASSPQTSAGPFKSKLFSESSDSVTENPFATRSKVASTPPPQTWEDPFKTESNLCSSSSQGNSDAGTENPFATRSKMASTPPPSSQTNFAQPVEDEFFEAEEEFVPAADVLKNNDMALLAAHSSLASGVPQVRESLLVNFDPLQEGQFRRKPDVALLVESSEAKRLLDLKQVELQQRQALQQHDDLMLMGTPKAGQQLVTGEKNDNVADDLLNITPQDTPKAGGESTATAMAKEGILYTEAEFNSLRRQLEMDLEARLLQKQRELSQEIEQKDEENKKLRESHDEMKKVIAVFENTLGEVMSEREKSADNNEEERLKEENEKLVRQRDQALEDVRSVESAFSDLHKRYEMSKQNIVVYQQNEQQLKECADGLRDQLSSEQNRYIELKQHAETKILQANEEIGKVRQSTQLELAKLQAALRKAEVEVRELKTAVQQKTTANEELSAICDELLAKVGTDS